MQYGLAPWVSAHLKSVPTDSKVWTTNFPWAIIGDAVVGLIARTLVVVGAAKMALVVTLVVCVKAICVCIGIWSCSSSSSSSGSCSGSRRNYLNRGGGWLLFESAPTPLSHSWCIFGVDCRDTAVPNRHYTVSKDIPNTNTNTASKTNTFSTLVNTAIPSSFLTAPPTTNLYCRTNVNITVNPTRLSSSAFWNV